MSAGAQSSFGDAADQSSFGDKAEGGSEQPFRQPGPPKPPLPPGLRKGTPGATNEDTPENRKFREDLHHNREGQGLDEIGAAFTGTGLAAQGVKTFARGAAGSYVAGKAAQKGAKELGLPEWAQTAAGIAANLYGYKAAADFPAFVEETGSLSPGRFYQWMKSKGKPIPEPARKPTPAPPVKYPKPSESASPVAPPPVKYPTPPAAGKVVPAPPVSGGFRPDPTKIVPAPPVSGGFRADPTRPPVPAPSLRGGFRSAAGEEPATPPPSGPASTLAGTGTGPVTPSGSPNLTTTAAHMGGQTGDDPRLTSLGVQNAQAAAKDLKVATYLRGKGISADQIDSMDEGELFKLVKAAHPTARPFGASAHSRPFSQARAEIAAKLRELSAK